MSTTPPVHYRDEKTTQLEVETSRDPNEQVSVASSGGIVSEEPVNTDLKTATVPIQQNVQRKVESLPKLLIRRLSNPKPKHTSPQPQSPTSASEATGGSARRKSIVRDPVQEAVRLFALEIIRSQEFRLMLCDFVSFAKHLLRQFSHAHRSRQLKLQKQDEIFGNTAKERDLIGRIRTVLRNISGNDSYRTTLLSAPLFLTIETEKWEEKSGDTTGGSEAVRMIEDYTGQDSMEKLFQYVSLIKEAQGETEEQPRESTSPMSQLLDRTWDIISKALETGVPCLEDFQRSATELLVDIFEIVRGQGEEDTIDLLSIFLGEARNLFRKFTDDEAVRVKSKAETSRQRYKLALRINRDGSTGHKTRESMEGQQAPHVPQTLVDMLVSLRDAACFAFSEQLLASQQQMPQKWFQKKTRQGVVRVTVNSLVLSVKDIQPSQLRIDVKIARPRECEDAETRRPDRFFKVKASQVQMLVETANWILSNENTQEHHTILFPSESLTRPPEIMATVLVWMRFVGPNAENSERRLELHKVRARIEMSSPILEEIGHEGQLIKDIIKSTFGMRHAISGMLEDIIIAGEAKFVQDITFRVPFDDLDSLFVDSDQS